MKQTKMVNIRKEKHEAYIGRVGHAYDGYLVSPILLLSDTPRGVAFSDERLDSLV